MNTSVRILAVLSIGLFFFCHSAMADAINPRPFTDFDTPYGGEQTLQQVFDDITTSGRIDVVDHQIAAALFQTTGTNNTSASFIIEIAGYAPSTHFGIYDAADFTRKAPIFWGDNSSGDRAFIEFTPTQMIVTTKDYEGGMYLGAAETIYGDFGRTFGFYIDVYGNDDVLDYTFYSEDSRNPGSEAQALIYQGDDLAWVDLDGTSGEDYFVPALFTDNEFIIAFEDLALDDAFAAGFGPFSDRDFQDLVVMVESIHPVPEPASMLLLGAGLMGAAAVGRRRRNG